MSRLGSIELFSRERQLLDRQEKPHGKRQGGKNPVDAEWEIWAVSFRQLGAVRRDVQRPAVEVEMRKGADPEDDQHSKRRQRHHQRDPERELHADDVQRQEQGVHQHPPYGLETRWSFEDASHVGAYEEDDHRRSENVFDVLAKSGDEAAPRSHRRAREGIRRTRMGERRRHLGDTEDEAEIHDHDKESGHQHAAPAAGREPEIPTRIVTRDNGAYAERPKRPDARVAPKSPFLEIGRVRLAVDHAPSTFLFCHMPHSFSFAKPPSSFARQKLRNVADCSRHRLQKSHHGMPRAAQT